MAWTAGLVFKGGTALRLTRFRDFRYSADLDFSLVDMEETEALDSFDAALPKVAARIAFPVLQLERGPRAEIAYVGPLARLRTIKLDLASDEVVVEGEPALILTRYDDQVGGLTVPSYTLPEVAAEKARHKNLDADSFDVYLDRREPQYAARWRTR
jgi:uncharacterized protein